MEFTIILLTFFLLFLYQAKHFVCDFVLQTQYMLGKFKESGWVLPLLAHSGVHSLATFVIAIVFVGPLFALLLAVFDLVVHFTMDRIKASPNLGGKYNPTEKRFWQYLGVDQMVHHVTHYVIILCIVLKYTGII